MTADAPGDVAVLRKALASLATDGSRDDVDAERIFDALHGNLSVDERQAVVDELLVNPAAAQAWRLAREMPARAATPSMFRASWTWMSMAAAALMAAGLGWQALSWRQAEEPAYRSVETRTIAPDLPTALARTHPVLRWTAVEGARYRVRVLTTDLNVLEESMESPAREHTLSEATLQRIQPGDLVLWQVEGRIPGETVIVSATFSIRVP